MKSCENCKWFIKSLCENTNYKTGQTGIMCITSTGKLSGWNAIKFLN